MRVLTNMIFEKKVRGTYQVAEKISQEQLLETQLHRDDPVLEISFNLGQSETEAMEVVVFEEAQELRLGHHERVIFRGKGTKATVNLVNILQFSRVSKNDTHDILRLLFSLLQIVLVPYKYLINVDI